VSGAIIEQDEQEEAIRTESLVRKVLSNEDEHIQLSGVVDEIPEDGIKDDEDKEEILRDDLINPYWMEDERLGDGPTESLPKSEINFFNGLIEKYLYPLIENTSEKKKIADGLIELRNRSFFAFFMMNAFFVSTVFLLQTHTDQLSVEWPFETSKSRKNLTITGDAKMEKNL